MTTQSLARIRLRLTAWYVGTFGLMLALLGGGLFLAVRSQITRQLDESLQAAAAELRRATDIRELEADSARGRVVDAVDELHIPGRSLFLLAADGTPVKPAATPAWVRRAAADARVASVRLTVHLPRDRELRVFAQPFTARGGTRYVAVAAADRGELDERYTALIGAFGIAALAALLLCAGGGFLLMRQSSAPVERAMTQMRRFMADAAHELRTPIAVLRGKAEVALQRERDAETYTAALRQIEAEAVRMGEIVDDLLTLARADSGEREIARSEFYLDDVALDAADAAYALSCRRGVSLEVGTFEEAPVMGDRALVRQLIMILLDNALKFTPRGGRVRVDVSGANGVSALVVEDTGVCIAAEQLPRIFDRFYRGDAARSRTDGAGLGLSIARWIADAHGAVIQLAPGAGGGTRATVKFARDG